MSICDIDTKTIGTLTLETRAYEDGHVQVSLLDEFGWEIASIDGNTGGSGGANTAHILESRLLEQHL